MRMFLVSERLNFEESFFGTRPAVMTKSGNTSPVTLCFRFRSFLLWDYSFGELERSPRLPSTG